MKTKNRGIRKETLKALGACLVSATMAGSMFTAPVFAESNTDANPTQKTETVYAVVNPDGTVSSTIVSSWLHDGDGIHNIKEDLDLKHVENIKTDEDPIKNGNTYTWNAKGDDVYYQGTTNKALPVKVSITYSMDGKTMSAKQMEGKSGHMKINVHFTNLISKTTSDGVVVHPGYLAGGILNLKTGNYSNVTCSSGKVMNDGSNQVLAFASVPGLADTLESAGLDKVVKQLKAADDCTIEADVDNFDLGDIMIGISNDFDLKELTTSNIPDLAGDVSKIVSASDQLESGAQQLYEGTSQLKTQAAPLTSASGSVLELSSALGTLNDGAQTMASGIHQYTNGVSVLKAGANQLYGIPSGVQQAQTGNQSLLSGAEQLEAGLAQMDSQIDPNQISKLQEQLKTANQQLSAMDTMVSKDKEQLNTLNDNLTKAQQSMAGLQTAQQQLSSLATDVLTQLGTDQQILQGDQSKIDSAVSSINAKIDATNQQISNANSSINAAYSSSISALQSAAAATDDESAKAQINEQISALQNAQASSGTISPIEHISADDLNLTTLSNLSQIKSDFDNLSTLFTTLSKTMNGMQSTIKDSNDTLNDLQKDIQTSQQGLDQMSALLKNTNTKLNLSQLSTAIKQLHTGSQQLVAGIKQLDSGLSTLQSQSKSGIDQLNGGIDQLNANSSTLNNGADQLASGTSQLASQQGKLQEMASGLTELDSAFTQLNDGASQLYSGEQQFNEEAMKPLEEMANLTEGEVQKLTNVFNDIKELTKENDNFAGKPEGAESKVNYVLRTSK